MEGIELQAALREAQGLVGAKLAKVHQVGDVLFLRFFSPSGALALDAGGKAFHLTSLRPPTPMEPPAFCRRVRGLEGQKLLAIGQAGLDRVIRLRFPGGELVLDLRPRLGNAFLIEEGRVVASLRPGGFQGVEFQGSDDPLIGLGPYLKRAAAAALGHPPNEGELRRFAAELLSLKPQGFLYRSPQGHLASFFPQPYLGEPLETFPRYWQALDRLLEERLSLRAAREYLDGIKRALRRRRRALVSLERESEEAARWEELQRKADLILARLHDIPRGAARATVEGFDGAPVSLDLDPALPPAEQAQRLYARARRLRRKLEIIPARLRELQREIERLEQLKALVEERPQLAPYLSGELIALGVLSKERPTGRPARPRQIVIEGFRVMIGRSAQENDELVRRASPRDLWLHARGVPGAHVIVVTGGRSVPEEVLRRAAELAAWHSQARGERKVEVSYTEVRHLRKPKGAPPGLVTVSKEGVIVVSGEGSP